MFWSRQACTGPSVANSKSVTKIWSIFEWPAHHSHPLQMLLDGRGRRHSIAFNGGAACESQHSSHIREGWKESSGACDVGSACNQRWVPGHSHLSCSLGGMRIILGCLSGSGMLCSPIPHKELIFGAPSSSCRRLLSRTQRNEAWQKPNRTDKTDTRTRCSLARP